MALLVVALLSAVCYRVGKSRYSKLLSRSAAVLFALYGCWLWSLKLRDGFHLGFDLPLALCDVIYILCLVCFVNPKPLLVTYVTYWGLGGTFQALVTPDLRYGFPHVEFNIFFASHSAIVLAVFFLLGKAPHERLAGWDGLKDAFSGLLGYTVMVGVFDLIFRVNYGYLLRKPAGASVLDLLGPWPVYVFAGLAIGFIIFLFLAAILKLLPGTQGEQGG
jgi:hypothetical integral membrane protein (TIGR02206 family)